jgi:glycosyltransferase involved in cell wall biosynthesis
MNNRRGRDAMRLFVPLTQAFGGRGGIAAFNRGLLRALSAHAAVDEIVAVPRVMHDAPGAMPDAVQFAPRAAGGLRSFLQVAGPHVLRGGYDGVVCGHLHLLPLAYVAARRARVPLLLVIHGIEARTPSDRPLANRLVPTVDAFVSVSRYTKERFEQWAGIDAAKGQVVPNGIDLSRFGPGPRPADLAARYGVEGRTVLFTLSRLPQQATGKGHDEVLEALPALAQERPDLVYLIGGDGPDRPRLEAKARRLGVADRVIFAGYVPEAEKADHYRLADAFVMPGRTEGFGIVYLEAMACGIPVVASRADASQEAVRGGALGEVVDPDDPASVKRGIRNALQRPRGVPEGLDYFSADRFVERWHAVITAVFAGDDASIVTEAA